MSNICDVVVISDARTAIGTFGGSLKNTTPSELAATVVRESVIRSGLKPEQIQHCVFGHVIHTDSRDPYIARVAAIEGGLPIATPAFTLNRLCGSGLQAIVSAALLIMLGDVDCVNAGGRKT